jgi:hypothetical protein
MGNVTFSNTYTNPEIFAIIIIGLFTILLGGAVCWGLLYMLAYLFVGPRKDPNTDD